MTFKYVSMSLSESVIADQFQHLVMLVVCALLVNSGKLYKKKCYSMYSKILTFLFYVFVNTTVIMGILLTDW